MKIFIITNPQYGWDCICGCFTSKELANSYLNESYLDFLEDNQEISFEDYLSLATYIIHEKTLISE